MKIDGEEYKDLHVITVTAAKNNTFMALKDSKGRVILLANISHKASVSYCEHFSSTFSKTDQQIVMQLDKTQVLGLFFQVLGFFGGPI